MLTYAHILMWLVLCLLGLAVVMVNSAGLAVGGGGVTAETLLWGRPTLYALIALAAMLIAARLDVRKLYAGGKLRSVTIWVLVGAAALCGLALVPGFGKNVNGASRWLNIGPSSIGFSFQPSELAKWAMVLALAWWGARKGAAMGGFWRGLLPGLVALGVVCGLIVLEDLGTAVLIGAVGVVMLIAAGAKLWHVGMLAPAAVAGVVGLIWTSPYRMNRLMAFADPWADPLGVGYHPIQSMVAVSGGELTGRGLGNGLQKFGYLPEDTTDFVFAIICEELGLAGAALVIGLYLAMMFVGLSVVKECRHPFGRLLGLGVLATVGIQAVINIAVVTVVMPTKGIALTLVSAGGTGWVMCAVMVGLLAAVDRLNRHVQDEVDSDEEEWEVPRVISISAARAARVGGIERLRPVVPAASAVVGQIGVGLKKSIEKSKKRA